MRDLGRTAFWIAFVSVCYLLGEHFHTYFFAAVAMTAVFVFGNYFLIKDGRSECNEQARTTETANRETRLVPGLFGLSWAIAIAIVMENWSVAAQPDERAISLLLGLPFGLPVGALFLGTLASSGYTFTLHWTNRRTSSADFYPIVGLSLLAFGLFQVLLFYAAGFVSLREFYEAYFIRLPYNLSVPTPLAGLAPLPALTLPLEALGFLIAGVATFLRAIPTGVPWARSEARPLPSPRQ